MKRYKKIYLLLGVLVAASLATVGMMQYQEHQDTVEATGEIVLEIDSDTVTALSWSYEDTSLSFYKDEIWHYDGDEAFPVDEEQINRLLSPFAALGAAFRIENVEDLSQYGLDTPICTIDMTANELDYTITLGDYSTMDEQRYLSLGDGTVYLVTVDPLDTYDCQLSDLILHDTVPDFGDISTISLSGEESYDIFYEENSGHTYSTEDVYFTEQNAKAVPLDTDLVEDYLSTLQYLDLTNYVTYQAAEEELIQYGLDTPDLTVTIDHTQEEQAATFTLTVGRNPEEVAAAADDEEALAALPAYVRIGASSIVYQITGEEYADLMAVSYDDLRHKEVLWADMSTITQLDITLDGETYVLSSTGEEDVWSYEDSDISITSIETALSSLLADSFTDEQPTEQKEISLTVSLNNENFSTVNIALYRYDGTSCLAVVDGTPVSLVPRSAVVDLMEAVREIVLSEA